MFFYSFGILYSLQALGIPTGQVIALTGVIGLAIYFGSQSLIKDMLNGCLILWEEQYAVGDVIAVGEVSGLVEKWQFSSTKSRDKARNI